MRVAAAAIAALAQHHALADLGQVREHRLAILGEDLGADGHLEDHILGRSTGAVAASAVAALACLEMLRVAVVDQRVEAIDRLDQHIAALAAIAAIGAAEFDVLLAAEGDDAIAAVSGLQVDLGFVEEFHDAISGVPRTDLRPAPAG